MRKRIVIKVLEVEFLVVEEIMVWFFEDVLVDLKELEIECDNLQIEFCVFIGQF